MGRPKCHEGRSVFISHYELLLVGAVWAAAQVLAYLPPRQWNQSIWFVIQDKPKIPGYFPGIGELVSGLYPLKFRIYYTIFGTRIDEFTRERSETSHNGIIIHFSFLSMLFQFSPASTGFSNNSPLNPHLRHNTTNPCGLCCVIIWYDLQPGHLLSVISNDSHRHRGNRLHFSLRTVDGRTSHRGHLL